MGRYIVLLIVIFSIIFVQAQEDTRPSMKLRPYECNMGIHESGKLVGFYGEQVNIFEKKDSRGRTQEKCWLFLVQKVFLDDKQNVERREILEIQFDNSFNVLFFEKSISASERSVWYKGEKTKEGMVYTNSRNVTKTIQAENIIPEEILLRYFLSTKQKEAELKAFNLTTGEFFDWKMTFEKTDTIKMNMDNPEDSTKHNIETYTVKAEADHDDGEKKRYSLFYEVAVKGRTAKPGVLVSFRKGSFEYKYRKVRSFTEGLSLPKTKKELLTELKSHVRLIVSGSKEEAITAMYNVRRLKIWQGVPVMIEMLRSEDKDIRNAAHTNLKKMTGRRLPLNVKIWRQWWLTYKATWERTNKKKIDFQ